MKLKDIIGSENMTRSQINRTYDDFIEDTEILDYKENDNNIKKKKSKKKYKNTPYMKLPLKARKKIIKNMDHFLNSKSFNRF